MNFLKRIFSKKHASAKDEAEKSTDTTTIKKEEVYEDKYGNSFSIERAGDKFVKVTQTNRYSDFEFLGHLYSYDILKQNKTLKTYVDEYHCQRLLQKDAYGRLLLYFYDEYMRTNGDDREDYLWVVMRDEAEADNFENTP